MKCPYCGSLQDKVLDSRQINDGSTIRRRRLCLQCERRFTTYERVEDIFPMVIKKDGRREPFDREKLLNGLKKACEKRPVSIDTLLRVVSEIENFLIKNGKQEVDSKVIGEEAMKHLKVIDKVAYVRFASVYREFKDVKEFVEEIKELFSHRP
ncbi:MAG: transcriptional repressor NrdR, partial [Nitrospirae bacterium]